jgi:uncharacterized membrane protein YdjX (TVP38/TMEM64 family)
MIAFRRWWPWIATIIVVGLLIGVYFFYLRRYMSLEIIEKNRELLDHFVVRYYWISAIVYLVLYILFILSSLPLPGFFTIIGGLMFGVLWGMILSWVAAVVGSALVFVFVRNFLATSIQDRYIRRFKKINADVEKHGSVYVLLAQLSALLPYFVVAFIAALTKLSFVKFVASTALGVIPGVYIYAIAGKKMGTVSSLSDLFSTDFYIGIGILIFIVGAGFVMKRTLAEQR